MKPELRETLDRLRQNRRPFKPELIDCRLGRAVDGHRHCDRCRCTGLIDIGPDPLNEHHLLVDRCPECNLPRERQDRKRVFD